MLVTDATQPGSLVVYANSAFSALSGYSLEEVIGRDFQFLDGHGSDPIVRGQIRAAVASGQAIRREILNYRKDGTPFWSDLAIDPICDPAGRLTGFICMQSHKETIDRADREKAEAATKLAGIADHIPGYIFQRVMRTDGSIEVLYCSPSIFKLLGVEGVEASRSFYEYIHPDDRDAVTAAIRRSAADLSVFREEFRLVSAGGVAHWVRCEAPSPRRMANGDIVWDGLALEIGAEKRWESEIASQALRDPLTGLLTRAAWLRALVLNLNADHGEPIRCGMAFIDIRDFRDLNHRLGPAAADDILRDLGRRLAGVAASVAGVAGRLGGDEFAILLPDCPGLDALSLLGLAAREALAPPMLVGARPITIETSIGLAQHQRGEQGETGADDPAGELVVQAELALRWAKQNGGNATALYSRERDDRFQNRTLLAQSLEHAIANDELELHYQPLVDLASGRIVSAEALVRWRHPTLGMQRPDLFIPLAETSGLIGPLGRWVLERALRQRGQWQDQGLAPPPIAINVSGLQLLDPGFAAMVEQSLRNTGTEATGFELELTEGLLIEPSPQIMTALTALRAMGFTIAIDDFGSGHASFRYLRDFPVDKLKIDQIFVRKLVVGSTDAMIIRAVISLARSMEIGFVAEGIETDMQREFLEREGCRIGQGYLFSMPLVAEDFAWLLANDVRLPRRAPEGPGAE
ncbi:MAG: putative bifunctional diguanylate cyclase/phosphodiesterase [Janthinobacterium lividum]